MPSLDGFKYIAGIKHYGSSCDTLYYFGLYDETIKIGDYVVVNTYSNPQIGIVKEILDYDDEKIEHIKIYKPVLGRLDSKNYDDYMNKKKEIDKIKKELNKKRKEISEAELHKYFSDINPEYKMMYDKLQELQK